MTSARIRGPVRADPSARRGAPEPVPPPRVGAITGDPASDVHARSRSTARPPRPPGRPTRPAFVTTATPCRMSSASSSARCSSVCARGPSSAATTSSAASISPAPTSMLPTSRSWPGTSTKSSSARRAARGGHSRHRSSSRAGAPRAADRRRCPSGREAASSCRGRCDRRCRRRASRAAPPRRGQAGRAPGVIGGGPPSGGRARPARLDTTDDRGRPSGGRRQPRPHAGRRARATDGSVSPGSDPPPTVDASRHRRRAPDPAQPARRLRSRGERPRGAAIIRQTGISVSAGRPDTARGSRRRRPSSPCPGACPGQRVRASARRGRRGPRRARPAARRPACRR